MNTAREEEIEEDYDEDGAEILTAAATNTTSSGPDSSDSSKAWKQPSF
jgi:hypothetical protein